MSWKILEPGSPEMAAVDSGDSGIWLPVQSLSVKPIRPEINLMFRTILPLSPVHFSQPPDNFLLIAGNDKCSTIFFHMIVHRFDFAFSEPMMILSSISAVIQTTDLSFPPGLLLYMGQITKTVHSVFNRLWRAAERRTDNRDNVQKGLFYYAVGGFPPTPREKRPHEPPAKNSLKSIVPFIWPMEGNINVRDILCQCFKLFWYTPSNDFP